MTGIAELRWVFQDGWPGARGPDGVSMLRPPADHENASGESIEGLEKLVMMVAPGGLEVIQTGASQKTRDG
ncbi:hypothetical protein MCHIJ_17740 [Mycolicibacterium chitae]|nr:hypothetical protein MCHIJ_17740 [Mycolicibacterium chitae]